MDFDEILNDIGGFGPYQRDIILYCLLPCAFPCAFHAYNQVFMSLTPPFRCKTLPGDEFEFKPEWNQCLVNSSGSTNPIPCPHGYQFNTSKATSVVNEWGLVCDKDFYVTLALVVLGIGGLLGNYIFGYIQDSLGRKPAFFLYLFIECVFGVATAYAQNFWTWTVFRFGVGFTVPAILGTPYVLGIELVGPHWRSLCTILANIAYSLGLISVALVVYAFRDWRQMALATTIPFCFFFLYWWSIPESPRWLLATGKFYAAEEIIRKMAAKNGKSLPPDYMTTLQIKYNAAQKAQHQNSVANSVEEKNRTYGLVDLFKTPNLRKKTLIITFIWFTNTSVYVGLSYFAAVLGGDEYINFLLAGAVELPTYIVLYPVISRYGRRTNLCVSMLIGGLACLATALPIKGETFTLILYCVGKMGISSSYVVLPLFASELYPTVVRGLGMSLSGVAGMLGPIFIPLVNYLGAEHITLPLILMGFLLVAGGLASLLLPETLNHHLPQTLEDGERFGKTKHKPDVTRDDTL
uniref:Organic cation transporter 1 n=1 Tax=Cacopsylla melanoneura TaxID=428564 RepID=A0A8D9FJ50_9HEMI